MIIITWTVISSNNVPVSEQTGISFWSIRFKIQDTVRVRFSPTARLRSRFNVSLLILTISDQTVALIWKTSRPTERKVWSLLFSVEGASAPSDPNRYIIRNTWTPGYSHNYPPDQSRGSNAMQKNLQMRVRGFGQCSHQTAERGKKDLWTQRLWLRLKLLPISWDFQPLEFLLGMEQKTVNKKNGACSKNQSRKGEKILFFSFLFSFLVFFNHVIARSWGKWEAAADILLWNFR